MDREAKTLLLARAACAALILAFVLFTGCRRTEPAVTVKEWPVGELRSGGEAGAADIWAGQTHRWRLRLEAGQHFRLVVEQRGVDVALTWIDPEDELILEVDRDIGDGGSELILTHIQRSGIYTLSVAWVGDGPGRYAARIEELRPANPETRRAAEAYRHFAEAERLVAEAEEEAMEHWSAALRVWREQGEEALEGEVESRIASHIYQHGRWRLAERHYRAAAMAFERAGDRRWEGQARNGLATVLMKAGDDELAMDQNEAALTLARQQGDEWTEAKALDGLGKAHRRLGQPQQALDYYQAALALWPREDRDLRPYTLHGLGLLHALHFRDLRRASDLFEQASAAWPTRSVTSRAITFSQRGRWAYEEERLEEAERYLSEALRLLPESKICRRTVVRARRVLVAAKWAHGLPADQRDLAERMAEQQMAQVLADVAVDECWQEKNTVDLLAGALSEQLGDYVAAQAFYRSCAERHWARKDQIGRAECLAGLASAARAAGDFTTALVESSTAIDILFGVRPTVAREDLRTSFFSTAQELVDLRVDLQIRQGEIAQAWTMAETARARSLRDLLQESGAGVRRFAAPKLVERERSLRRRLNVLERSRLEAQETSRQDLAGPLNEVMAELETVRGDMRRQSPRYASLTPSEALTLGAVQRELLDEDTLLLQFRLGMEQSYLWAVSAEASQAFLLPPRSEIEAVARVAARWQQGLEWPESFPVQVCAAGRMLLEPAAALIASHARLVIVADGVLEALSFAALPDLAGGESCPEAAPLVEGHEIVYTPSVSTLLAQRRIVANRPSVAGLIAVIADPVYGLDDQRLPASTGALSVLSGFSGDRGAASAVAGKMAVTFTRLPYSAQESEMILAGRAAEKTFAASGVDASKATVTSGVLAEFRILHFAMHGVLNDRHPLLSLLALAQFDEHGKSVDGLLAAHEIYDLDLPAELVVLSACDTAGGEDIVGEGRVSGLPRAFLYAGAARVMVSLWAVDDRSTPELMERFYDGLLTRELPPGLALAEAQRSLWKSGLPPRQWAGFVLQGDWRPLPSISN